MPENRIIKYPDSLGNLVSIFSEGAFTTGNFQTGKRVHICKYVCENGIFERDYWENEKVILWDDIDAIFLNATKDTLNFLIPIGEKMGLRICSINGGEINFDLDATFRFGGKDKDRFWGAYQLIISKIEARQWAKLIADFDAGLKISFKEFEISQEGIRSETKWKPNTIISLSSIIGCNYMSGSFLLMGVNKKGRVVAVGLGEVEKIPNIYLAERLLNEIGRKNTKAYLQT